MMDGMPGPNKYGEYIGVLYVDHVIFILTIENE